MSSIPTFSPSVLLTVLHIAWNLAENSKSRILRLKKECAVLVHKKLCKYQSNVNMYAAKPRCRRCVEERAYPSDEVPEDQGDHRGVWHCGGQLAQAILCTRRSLLACTAGGLAERAPERCHEVPVPNRRRVGHLACGVHQRVDERVHEREQH